MMMSYPRSVVLVAAVWLMVGALATPVRRSPDLEARRRSAIDRSFVRLGRSYPPEPSIADLREAFQAPSRRGNSFLRFGRTRTSPLTEEDLVALLKEYFKRTIEDEKIEEQSPELFSRGFPNNNYTRPQRNHFIRLGRDSEELNDVTDFEEERRKRSSNFMS